MEHIKFKNEMGGACGTYGRQDIAYRLSVRILEGKRPLGGHRRRYEDNIKMDLQKVIARGMDWITLAQDRDRWRALLNVVRNLRVPSNAGNLLTS
jgi:hypothetical protein